MKNKKIFLALIMLLIIFALYIGYRYRINSENTPTQTTILSGTIVDESQLFYLDYLEQYS